MADKNPNEHVELGRPGNSVSSASLGDFIMLLAGQNLDSIEVEVSFDDPQGAEKSFAPHYERYIRPHIQSFEKKRVAALKAIRRRTLITIPILIVLIPAVIAIANAEILNNKFLYILAFITVLGLGIWCAAPATGYKSAIKEKIFPNIFSFFGEDFQYSEKEGNLYIGHLIQSDIIPDYNSQHTEDYVKGSYKDVVLELVEAKLSWRSGKKRDGREKVRFKGVIILLSMNKNFSGKTIVKRDAGMISNWVTDKTTKLKKVSLEDSVFEKKFEVYSSDQVEARYLVTTSFMQRLLELSVSFGDLGLECSFYNDKLLLMVPSSENYFEASSIFQPANFIADIKTTLEEMHMIFQIVDILKLHQRTGL